MGILFTGNCYFESSAAKLPYAQDPKSVCFWIQTNTFTGTQSVFNATNSTLGSGYQIGLRSGNMSMWGFGGTVAVSSALSSELTHCVYSFDGAQHQLFFNGQQVAISTAAPQSGQPLICQVGSNQWNEYSRNSFIEDLRVYSRALSLNEVQTIYGCNATDYIVDGLVAHWPCNDLVENQTVSANQFIDYYGSVSTTVGTSPYPAARGSRLLQRRR